MKVKICIVTGANSGIGRVTAQALAQQGATVLMVCRNRGKGEAALREIKERSGNGNVVLFPADLASQKEVRSLAEEISARYPKVDVLVNNAGGIHPTRTLTADGFETTFAVNHLAYFLLTNLLLAQLRASPAARIVNVTSQAHRYGRIFFDDLGLEKRFNPMMSYAQSKLANILFTYELARRLRGTMITVNTLHPGGVRTNFGKELTGIAGFVFRHLGFVMRSPQKGAETVIWLATSPDVEGVTGKYFLDKKEIRSSKISYDVDVARRLWQTSAELTGLKSTA
jgi:NAD(P)-dependent dehydrogenase (short-subunit alcohol dehydrogenase family)